MRYCTAGRSTDSGRDDIVIVVVIVIDGGREIVMLIEGSKEPGMEVGWEGVSDG